MFWRIITTYRFDFVKLYYSSSFFKHSPLLTVCQLLTILSKTAEDLIYTYRYCFSSVSLTVFFFSLYRCSAWHVFTLALTKLNSNSTKTSCKQCILSCRSIVVKWTSEHWIFVYFCFQILNRRSFWPDIRWNRTTKVNRNLKTILLLYFIQNPFYEHCRLRVK